MPNNLLSLQNEKMTELKSIIENIKKQYDFLAIPEKIFYEKCLSIENIDNLDNKEIAIILISLINEYVKSNISEDAFAKLLCTKLEKELKPTKNPLDMLEVISDLLKKLDYELTIDQAEYLLDNVPIVKIKIKELVNKYKKIINLGNMEMISDVPLILTLIDIYCDKNDIDTVSNAVELSKAEIKSLEAIALYLNDINLPLLSRNEEKKYAEKYQEGDMLAREILIERNLKLVVNIAKKYQGQGIDFLDLIQEGNIGLITGIDKYDPAKGYKISTYVTWWIRQTITRAIAEKSTLIRIPVHLFEKQRKILVVANKLSQELEEEPDIEDVALELDLPVPTVRKISENINRFTSLDKKVGEDEDTELSEFIPDEKVKIEDDFISKDTQKLVMELLDKCDLTDREISILNLRFGLNGKDRLTLKEIAKMYNVSRERIRQIERRALEKIRNSPSIKEIMESRNSSNEDESGVNKSKSVKKAPKKAKSDVAITSVVYYDISKINNGIIPNLKDIIAFLNSKDQKIFLLYLGYYEGRRLSISEKSKLIGLNNTKEYNDSVARIIEQIRENFPDINDLANKLKQIRIINCEKIKLEKDESKNYYELIRQNVLTNLSQKEKSKEERIKEIILYFPEVDQKIANYYLGFYEGERLSRQKKSEKLGMSKSNFVIRTKKIIALIKSFFLEENIDFEIDKIRGANGEFVKKHSFQDSYLASSLKDDINNYKEVLHSSLNDDINSSNETLTSNLDNGNKKVLDQELENWIVTELSKILRNQDYKDLMRNFTVEESSIIGLRYGKSLNILDRNYTTFEISSLLKIEEERIINICFEVLLYFKDKLGVLLDEKNVTLK